MEYGLFSDEELIYFLETADVRPAETDSAIRPSGHSASPPSYMVNGTDSAVSNRRKINEEEERKTANEEGTNTRTQSAPGDQEDDEDDSEIKFQKVLQRLERLERRQSAGKERRSSDNSNSANTTNPNSNNKVNNNNNNNNNNSEDPKQNSVRTASTADSAFTSCSASSVPSVSNLESSDHDRPLVSSSTTNSMFSYNYSSYAKRLSEPDLTSHDNTTTSDNSNNKPKTRSLSYEPTPKPTFITDHHKSNNNKKSDPTKMLADSYGLNSYVVIKQDTLMDKKAYPTQEAVVTAPHPTTNMSHHSGSSERDDGSPLPSSFLSNHDRTADSASNDSAVCMLENPPQEDSSSNHYFNIFVESSGGKVSIKKVTSLAGYTPVNVNPNNKNNNNAVTDRLLTDLVGSEINQSRLSLLTQSSVDGNPNMHNLALFEQIDSSPKGVRALQANHNNNNNHNTININTSAGSPMKNSGPDSIFCESQTITVDVSASALSDTARTKIFRENPSFNNNNNNNNTNANNNNNNPNVPPLRSVQTVVEPPRRKSNIPLIGRPLKVPKNPQQKRLSQSNGTSENRKTSL